MAEHTVDLSSWPRADQFRFFRTYTKPHYAVTSRLDVSRLVARKDQGLSMYRASLYAIGAGLHAVPELLMRFRGDVVVRHDRVAISMPVPNGRGSFNFGYLDWSPDFAAFDQAAEAEIARAAAETALNPHSDKGDAVAYASCLPWMDYTSISNAMPSAEDCIPRVAWGKFVDQGGGWDVAMTLEVHHALVDGEQVGAYFTAVQSALDQI